MAVAPKTRETPAEFPVWQGGWENLGKGWLWERRKGGTGDSEDGWM